MAENETNPKRDTMNNFVIITGNLRNDFFRGDGNVSDRVGPGRARRCSLVSVKNTKHGSYAEQNRGGARGR